MQLNSTEDCLKNLAGFPPSRTHPLSMPLFLATWPEPVPVPSLKACSAPGLAWRLVSNFFHKHCFCFSSSFLKKWSKSSSERSLASLRKRLWS